MDRDVMFTMEITRLIERCKQGDADALGELYKAYAQRMRGVCRRYISDEQTVEDVLHDAFVIIFTSHTTESIYYPPWSYLRCFLFPNRDVVVRIHKNKASVTPFNM